MRHAYTSNTGSTAKAGACLGLWWLLLLQTRLAERWYSMVCATKHSVMGAADGYVSAALDQLLLGSAGYASNSAVLQRPQWAQGKGSWVQRAIDMLMLQREAVRRLLQAKRGEPPPAAVTADSFHALLDQAALQQAAEGPRQQPAERGPWRPGTEAGQQAAEQQQQQGHHLQGDGRGGDGSQDELGRPDDELSAEQQREQGGDDEDDEDDEDADVLFRESSEQGQQQQQEEEEEEKEEEGGVRWAGNAPQPA